MQGIRSLFALLQAKGAIIKNPMSTLKINSPEKRKTPKTILSIEEIKQLYSVTDTLQQRAILSLFYGCGLRGMEVVTVGEYDIKYNDNILIVQNGKGNKRRTVPLSPKVKQDLENYYTIERPQYIINPQEHTFLLNIKGKPMRKYTCRKILLELIQRTGNEHIKQKNIRPHHLRHSIATHLLEQGVQLEKVRDFLGHSQLDTTEMYTRVNQKQLKTLMNQNT
jgi:integrase/recombinase XerD